MKFILLLSLAASVCFAAPPTLINGEVVTGFPHIISIRTGSSGCTATVVGKRAIITAAHCAGNGATSTFSINGVSYSAKITRSPIYPGRDHDIALGVVAKDVDVKPSSIVNRENVLAKGSVITLFGYGCINQGGGQWDGKLRRGNATVSSFSGFDAVSTGGSALCYGDSGGPAYTVADANKPPVLITINSKGDIARTNYTARLDLPESQSFMKQWASTNNVSICGVTTNCEDAPAPPNPAPFFVMDAVTQSIKVTIRSGAVLDEAKLKNKLRIGLDALDRR